jgi:hypothetical protein
MPTPKLSRTKLSILCATSAALLGGCFYRFDLSPEYAKDTSPRGLAADAETRTYEERAPRYLGGMATGVHDAKRYCAHPVRVQSRVDAPELVAAAATGFLYEPQKVYITCVVPRRSDEGVAQ